MGIFSSLGGLASFIPGVGPLVGAGLGLAGSLIDSNSQKKAAKKAAAGAAFNPYNTSNMFGSASWSGNTLNQQMSPFAQQMAQYLQGQATGGMGSQWGSRGEQFMGQGAADLGSAYGAANQYGMPQGLFDSVSGGYSSLLNGADPAAMGAGANEQMAMGRGLLGNRYGDVAANQLNLMRQQAAPGEEQAYNSLQQRMFSQGRMGSTGGGRDMQAFAKGLGEADISRQLGAQQFAQGLYSQDQATGSSMFNSGVGNLLQSLGLSGQQQLGALSGLGNFGMDFNNTGYSRANDRVARAESMFGFGEALRGSGTRQSSEALNLLSGLAGQQNNLADIGLRAGGAAASAGANQGQFMMGAAGSPVGSFFQGFGGALLGAPQPTSAPKTPPASYYPGNEIEQGQQIGIWG
jgi:hypothetical protein